MKLAFNCILIMAFMSFTLCLPARANSSPDLPLGQVMVLDSGVAMNMSVEQMHLLFGGSIPEFSHLTMEEQSSDGKAPPVWILVGIMINGSIYYLEVKSGAREHSNEALLAELATGALGGGLTAIKIKRIADSMGAVYKGRASRQDVWGKRLRALFIGKQSRDARGRFTSEFELKQGVKEFIRSAAFMAYYSNLEQDVRNLFHTFLSGSDMKVLLKTELNALNTIRTTGSRIREMQAERRKREIRQELREIRGNEERGLMLCRGSWTVTCSDEYHESVGPEPCDSRGSFSGDDPCSPPEPCPSTSFTSSGCDDDSEEEAVLNIVRGQSGIGGFGSGSNTQGFGNQNGFGSSMFSNSFGLSGAACASATGCRGSF